MGKVAELHKIDERLIDMHSSAVVARARTQKVTSPKNFSKEIGTWAAMTRCLSAIRLHLAQEQSLH